MFDPEAWRNEALCAQVDPELFFPEPGCKTNEAKRICKLCPVQDDCLEWALWRTELDGVWGGLSERERAKERHDRRRAA